MRQVLLATIFVCSAAIQLERVVIDTHVTSGSQLSLVCQADVDPGAIYTAKWYKDGREFYRFQPDKQPPAISFGHADTRVDLSKSDSWNVLIEPVVLNSAGTYGCEVTARDSFDTVTASGVVRVVELPHTELFTSLRGNSTVEVGDLVEVNCSSLRSRPVADLHWFINNEKAAEWHVTRFPVSEDEAGLLSAVIRLKLRLTSSHMIAGLDDVGDEAATSTPLTKVILKCTASIENVYYSSRQVVLVSQRRRSVRLVTSSTGALHGGGFYNNLAREFFIPVLTLIFWFLS